MTVKLGLTGSIGMGKTTTAEFFRQGGVPVWDADGEVHRLYNQDQSAIADIGKIAPKAVKSGFVDRDILKAEIRNDPQLLPELEAALRPHLSRARADFLAAHQGRKMVLFDIPLLFETGAESWLDYVLVVTAPAELQRQRVLQRKTMDAAMFETILSRQMPDAEKRKRADFVFDTSMGMAQTKADVAALIKSLEAKNA